MGAAPLAREAALDALLGQWAADGPEAWERWLAAHRRNRRRDRRRSSARRRAAYFSGQTFRCCRPRSERCIDFNSERNEVVYESLQFPSLTYVWREWERYGAVIRDRSVRRWPHDSDRAHRRGNRRKDGHRRASRTRITFPVRSPTSARFKRTAAKPAHCLCVDAYQTTGIVAIRRDGNWSSTW